MIKPFRTVVKTVTLTNAQIKALPTTPVSVIATGGAGTILLPLGVTYTGHFQTAYTNVDIAAALEIRFAGSSDSELGRGHFIAQSGQWKYGSVGLTEQVALRGQFAADLAFSLLGFDDTALVVGLANAALGNLTGGHANNTLAVRTQYIVIDNPAVLRIVGGEWVLDDDPSGSAPDGYLTTPDGGVTLIISTTAERGLLLTNNAGIPEASYP